MPFPHIVKVIDPFRLIKKLRKVINYLLGKNRKLARENLLLNFQILVLSDKLSHEVKKHSKATAIIDDLILQLKDCDEYINYLKSQLEENNKVINDQENEIASMNELIRDIYDKLQGSGIDF